MDIELINQSHEHDMSGGYS